MNLNASFLWAALGAVVLCLAALIVWHAARGSPHRHPRTFATAGVLAGAAALVLGLGLYGVPGQGGSDDGDEIGRLESTLRKAQEDASHPEVRMRAQLEQQLRRSPDDPRALVLMARLDMRAERFAPAAAGFEKALSRPGKVASDATVWVEYAEARGMLQGGSLLGEPLRLVHRALALDGTNPHALDLAGSGAWEARDFDQAAKHWKLLLQQLQPDSPRYAELSAAIERAQQRRKVTLPPLPDQAGPSKS